MSTAEEIREVITVQLCQPGVPVTARTNSSPAVRSGSGSRLSIQIAAGPTARLGGNSTQPYFEKYMRMTKNASAGGTQPISIPTTPPAVPPVASAEDVLWEAVVKATPSKEKLSAIAKNFTPPDSWFDEEDVF